MQVILLEQIKNLGDLGDTVKVRPGFGRNFLLPQGKALVATDANRQVYEERKAELLAKAEATLGSAKARSADINGKVVKIAALTSDEGKLYGSIGPNDIVAAAEAAGITLKKAEVDMPTGPIRQIGSFEVHVLLHSEVETRLTVEVVEEKASA